MVYDHIKVKPGMERLLPVSGDNEDYGLELTTGRVLSIAASDTNRGVGQVLAIRLVDAGVCVWCDSKGTEAKDPEGVTKRAKNAAGIEEPAPTAEATAEPDASAQSAGTTEPAAEGRNVPLAG